MNKSNKVRLPPHDLSPTQQALENQAVMAYAEHFAIAAVLMERERLKAAMGAPPSHNPWRVSLENCSTRDNYLRDQEYIDLIGELDSLYALLEALRSQEAAPIAAGAEAEGKS